MGMFDYVHVNLEKLPLTDEEKKSLGANPSFQTKHFDCILTNIRITDDGELEIDRFDYGFDKDSFNAFGIKGCLTHENERTEKIPYHGYFNFYTHNKKKEWIEFNAKFTDGKLVEITKAITD
jgi:hypothetical protein